MARVALDHKIPQIGQPVGGKSEIEDLDLPTRNIATCSRRVDKENFGCPMYGQCDREFRGERPQNEVVRIVTSDGGERVTVNPCYVNVKKELEANGKGMLVEVIGHEGDEYTYRGSVKVDSDCPDCKRGECKRPHMYRDSETLKATCPEFPAAVAHRELVKFARLRAARTKTSAQTKASLRRQLLGPDEPQAAEKGKTGARA